METVVEVEEIFNVAPIVVWTAITEIDQMKQWYFENIPAFVPTIGFKTEFNVRSTDRDFYHLWEIKEVIKLKKISYSWKYRELTGESIVSFTLLDLGDQTKLNVTCVGLESFPDDIPEFTYESCLAGWNYFIKMRLKKYLDGKK